jgi:hypothetical protein
LRALADDADLRGRLGQAAQAAAAAKLGSLALADAVRALGLPVAA